MSSAVQAMIQELHQEVKSTRNLFAAIPPHRLAWKPHEKSMTLGQLAMHVAMLPGNISKMADEEGFDIAKSSFQPAQAESKEQILKTLETSVADASRVLATWDDAKSMEQWKLSKGDRELFTLPRIGVVRNLMLNHFYHHRGQLTVYLRLLDVPLPVTYGRSADTNPFG